MLRVTIDVNCVSIFTFRRWVYTSVCHFPRPHTAPRRPPPREPVSRWAGPTRWTIWRLPLSLQVYTPAIYNSVSTLVTWVLWRHADNLPEPRETVSGDTRTMVSYRVDEGGKIKKVCVPHVLISASCDLHMIVRWRRCTRRFGSKYRKPLPKDVYVCTIPCLPFLY